MADPTVAVFVTQITKIEQPDLIHKAIVVTLEVFLPSALGYGITQIHKIALPMVIEHASRFYVGQQFELSVIEKPTA